MKSQLNYMTIIHPKAVCLGEVEHFVTVKKINAVYHVRIFTNNVLNQEGITYQRFYISTLARNLLRTEDKCGNYSAFASSARKRLNGCVEKIKTQD